MPVNLRKNKFYLAENRVHPVNPPSLDRATLQVIVEWLDLWIEQRRNVLRPLEYPSEYQAANVGQNLLINMMEEIEEVQSEI